jgi:glycosyltransferase involved in cell wall biosynthesis
MRILQVFRAPVGGLFRHVRDLVQAQFELGHEVGIICDATTGGDAAALQLKQLEKFCSLGITRIEMSRLPGIGDAISARRVAEIGKKKDFDIAHGHGAKGGVYVRYAAAKMGAKAIYTAHGGSLHYSWNSASGAIFLGVERMLMARTDGLVFVCDYERATFDKKIGIGSVAHTVVHNGLWPHEFNPTPLVKEATDILFIGELRKLKGVDILIQAVARHKGLTATIVGDGPDREQFETLVLEKGLSSQIRFTGALPAAQAFGFGRLMIIPSRAESFPYIVLEAIAAHKPLIASDVGGIGEVMEADRMVEADNVAALSAKIGEFLANPAKAARRAKSAADELKLHKSTAIMAADICKFYEQCLGGTASCSTAA